MALGSARARDCEFVYCCGDGGEIVRTSVFGRGLGGPGGPGGLDGRIFGASGNERQYRARLGP